jgi:hypothetical protein
MLALGSGQRIVQSAFGWGAASIDKTGADFDPYCPGSAASPQLKIRSQDS